MNQREYLGAPPHLRVAPHQQRCDTIQADFHAEGSGHRPLLRRDPPPLDPALVPTDDALRLRLADELEYARRMIEAMGDELSNDGSVVMRHSVALQSVDIVGQMLGHIAAVTRSSAPDLAVERIGMCELTSRLKRSVVQG